jgi:predicted nucleic acid-binding protein
VSSALVLDATPLGRLAYPSENAAVADWLREVLASGRRVVVPEVSDYEVRRGLLHQRENRPRDRKLIRRVERLEKLGDDLYYAPIKTRQMRRAAEVWGKAKARGITYGPAKALGADAILISQAESFGDRRSVTVITANPGHLSPFVNVAAWEDFDP